MKSFKTTFNNWKSCLTTLVLSITLSFSSGHAQTLFNNGGPDMSNFSETWNSDPSVIGDVFTPTLSGTANSVTFAGDYYLSNTVPTTDSFTLSLYSVSGGAPSTLLSTSLLSGVTRSVVGTGGPGDSYTVYSFTGALTTPLTLNTGTSYFLGFTDATSPNQEFNMAFSTGPATAMYQNGGGVGSFTSHPGVALSFSLSGTEATPEPSTWAMMLGGLGLLAFLSGRARRA